MNRLFSQTQNQLSLDISLQSCPPTAEFDEALSILRKLEREDEDPLGTEDLFESIKLLREALYSYNEPQTTFELVSRAHDRAQCAAAFIARDHERCEQLKIADLLRKYGDGDFSPGLVHCLQDAANFVSESCRAFLKRPSTYNRDNLAQYHEHGAHELFQALRTIGEVDGFYISSF